MSYFPYKKILIPHDYDHKNKYILLKLGYLAYKVYILVSGKMSVKIVTA